MQTMSKSIKTSLQTDNEPKSTTIMSNEATTNEVEELTKEATRDLAKDNDAKSSQTSESTKRIRRFRDLKRGSDKSSSVAKTEPEQYKTKNLDTKIGDQNERDHNTIALSDVSNSKNLEPAEGNKPLMVDDESSDNTDVKVNTTIQQVKNGDAGNSTVEDKREKNIPANGAVVKGKQKGGDSQSIESSDTVKSGKKPFTNLVKSWLGMGAIPQVPLKRKVQDSTDEESDCVISAVQLIELPKIPLQFRAKEINGFGVLSSSQKLPKETKKEYTNLLHCGVTCVLLFCKSLEIMNQRSKKQDIRESFTKQFTKMHSELAFTKEDLKTNGDINTELLLHLKMLFNDLFSNNSIIWIVNKMEYDNFGRKFRKTIAKILREEFQYNVSHKTENFYREVVAASLSQWRRNIPFPG